MAVQPGRDTNYPSSVGSIAGMLSSTQFSVNGFHITIGILVTILLMLIIWNMARATLRKR